MNTDKNPRDVTEENIADKLEYNPAEDIYNQEDRVALDENGNVVNDDELEVNEAEEKMIGGDLDVPGSELDDDNEIIGEEDEENNYYSLGGDNHEDLEEENS